MSFQWGLYCTDWFRGKPWKNLSQTTGLKSWKTNSLIVFFTSLMCLIHLLTGCDSLFVENVTSLRRLVLICNKHSCGFDGAAFACTFRHINYTLQSLSLPQFFILQQTRWAWSLSSFLSISDWILKTYGFLLDWKSTFYTTRFPYLHC